MTNEPRDGPRAGSQVGSQREARSGSHGGSQDGARIEPPGQTRSERRRTSPRLLLHEMRLFLVGLQLLTRIPIPARIGFDPAWLRGSVRHFPLVGAVVGAWAAAVLWVAMHWWPPLVASALSLISTLWLTGAFHEDGLADTCDALGGAVDRERALAIMKDSRIGSYGAVALVMALTTKTFTVAALATELPSAMAALVWSHAISRAAPVVITWWLPYAGDAEHAKARPLATGTTASGPLVAATWVVVLGGLLAIVATGTTAATARWAVPLTLVAGGATTVAFGAWLRRRLGGFTGDTLGATQQIVEAVGLLSWLAVAGARHAG